MITLEDNELICSSFNTNFGTTEDLQEYYPAAIHTDAISISIGNKICALNSLYHIFCWDNHKTYLHDAKFKIGIEYHPQQILVDDAVFCTMDKLGKVFCSLMDVSSNFMLPGKYKFIYMQDFLLCGINFNNNLAC